MFINNKIIKKIFIKLKEIIKVQKNKLKKSFAKAKKSLLLVEKKLLNKLAINKNNYIS